MASSTLEVTDLGYKVADMTLADWGRKEINIAEQEMPGLMSIGTNMRRASRWPGCASRVRCT